MDKQKQEKKLKPVDVLDCFILGFQHQIGARGVQRVISSYKSHKSCNWGGCLLLGFLKTFSLCFWGRLWSCWRRRMLLCISFVGICVISKNVQEGAKNQFQNACFHSKTLYCDKTSFVHFTCHISVLWLFNVY